MPLFINPLPICLLVVVEHMRENIFGASEPLGHLSFFAVKGLVKWHCRAFSILVNTVDVLVIQIEQNISVVLEIQLLNFVVQPECDCALGLYPFFHVYRPRWVLQLVSEAHYIHLDKLCFLL